MFIGDEFTSSTSSVCITLLKRSYTSPIEKSKEMPNTKLRAHFCFISREFKTCIGRHLQKMHKYHPKVQEVCQEQDLREKRKLLTLLRREGDRIYNLQCSPGKRIPVRFAATQEIKNFVTCPNCKGLFARRHFSLHDRKCTKRPPDGTKIVRLAIEMEQESKGEPLDEILLRAVYKDMLEDEIGNIAKSDATIRLLALQLRKEHYEAHHLANTRSQLRRCARLLIEVKRRKEAITCFADCFHPKYYKLLTEGIRTICAKTSEDGKVTFERPSLALQFGPLFSKICRRLLIQLKYEEVPNHDPRYKQYEDFLTIHESDFKTEVSMNALRDVKNKKLQKYKQLPSNADVRLFSSHLRDVVKTTMKKLHEEDFSQHVWKRLGEAILCQLMVFNRRRPGEASRMILSDYFDKRRMTTDESKYLTRYQKILNEKMCFMFLTGKRLKPLNLLLKEEFVEALDFYISFRNKAGISPNNVYLFPDRTKVKHLNASVAMKKFTSEIQLEKPNLITGTYLRKQVATKAQLLTMDHNEMQILADFMGHSIEVHKENYRMSDTSTHLLKLTRFLSVISGDDDIEKFCGKSFEELQEFIPHEDYDLEDVLELENFDENLLAKELLDEPLDDDVVAADSKKTGQKEQTYRTPTKRVITRSFKRKESESIAMLTPERSTAETPHKMQRISPGKPRTPSTKQLEAILSDPSKRQKLTWNKKETALLQTIFKTYIENKKLPTLNFCKKVLAENKDVFQTARKTRSLYSWIQYRIK
ncbi:uncharacterized protein LOC135143858 [Zophobas morio]|uniref:uncharacterized protein LOC135143858 n=1 Tax=Zophobas morio TaxID=2755281 RepID=UPI003082BCB6